MTSSTPSHQALADLRHDLRTPIGQIMGYAEMLLEDAAENAAADGAMSGNAAVADLEKIQAAARSLLTLVDNRLSDAAFADAFADVPIPVVALMPSPIAELCAMDAPANGVAPAAAHEGSLECRLTDNLEGHDELVLAVDDDAQNRDVLARRLERQGHRVVTAANGREALARLAEQPFNLVLLDIMMPEMDGYEVLSRIKSDATLHTVPVIMISALDEMDSVVRCIEMGAADYLPKPFNPVLLKARVEACLRDKRARDREMLLFAQLGENYKRLQELEKLRDDLTHMIVHDLRSPLASLLTGVQMLPLLGSLNEEQNEVFDIAVRSSKTLLAMINDLLDISKLEAGSMQLEREPLRIEGLVEEAVEQIAASLKDKKLSLQRDVMPGLPPLPADEDLLRRTLVNLLGNAIKFTPKQGAITIAAWLSEDSSSGDTSTANRSMVFSVRDTGEGIPPEAAERIFEKFGQVESRRAGRSMSSGLGLTFCKMVVEAHGGRIWVESEPGEGSTFWITLPLLSRDDIRAPDRNK